MQKQLRYKCSFKALLLKWGREMSRQVFLTQSSAHDGLGEA